MSLIRRAILAAVLLAGFSPAIVAQVPPPVPALPDTERRTSYSISASTCACAVGFQIYGDSTDYGNWLEVFVNGIRTPQAGNWTIASPSGSLATLPRPISDAVLTFVTAQTGTIQIVGARRPRRTSQFQESQPVPTRNFNQTFSDITATLRELWDKTNTLSGRVPQAPAGETMAALPPLANRQNQGACFNSSGNLIPCVSIPASTFIAGNGISLTGVGPTTITNNISAGAGITFTGTNPITISVNPAYITPSFTCDGATDFGSQLQTLITNNAGKTIFIPGGPDCLTSISLSLPSNTTITGAGREISTIRGIGAAGNTGAIFTATNKTNISLSNFWCKGSDQVVSWTISSYGCFSFFQNGSAVSDSSAISLTNMKFSNFDVSYWNYVSLASSGLQRLMNFTYENNYMLTAAGDIPTDGTPSNNTNYGLYLISGSAGNGRVENAVIRNNRIEATGMCFPLALNGNLYKLQVVGNIVLNAGQTTPAHCVNGGGTTYNSYGTQVYDPWGDGNPATNFTISGNQYINPYAGGLYVVGDGTVGHNASVYNSSVGSLISNNLVVGQTSQDDISVPRAGIIVASVTDVNVIGNVVQNGYGGIIATGQTTGMVNIEGNTCISNMAPGAGTPYCIKLTSGANGSSNTSKHIIKGNYLELSNTAASNVIFAASTTGARYSDVEISENTINAGSNGLNFQNQFVSGSFVVKNNKFGGVANSFMASLSGLTGVAAVVGNIFDSSGGANGNGLVAQSDTIHMANNKFINRASGSVAMLNLVGSCGTIMGTQFNAVVQTAQVAATSLGTSNPSGCTLNYLDEVQNLTPSEAGSAASKYVVDHWKHVSTTSSTTHLDQRQLTGN